jgi:hypothetical protein
MIPSRVFPPFNKKTFPPPLKHVRYPDVTAMTVCIAAIASLPKEDPSIVFCADTRLEIQDFASSETGWKIRWISDQWLALLAGNLSSAHQLAGWFQGNPPPKDKGVDDAVEHVSECSPLLLTAHFHNIIHGDP